MFEITFGMALDDARWTAVLKNKLGRDFGNCDMILWVS